MGRADWVPVLLALAAVPGTQASANEPPAPGASAPRAARAAVARLPTGVANDKAADKSGAVSVWVNLQLPELASVPRDRQAERAALAFKIRAQQDEVMAQLRELGAVELARVQQVRNALAVRLAGAQLEAARRIPGVRSVRPTRDIDRGPLVLGK